MRRRARLLASLQPSRPNDRLPSSQELTICTRRASGELRLELRRVRGCAPAFRLYEGGLVVKWRSVVSVYGPFSAVGLERRSCLYGLLVGRTRRNWMFARAQVRKGRSGRQTKSGASWSELFLAGKHVPDRVGKSAGDVDLGDFGTALLSKPALGSLVALGVSGVP
jgi:hypothetical protein